MSDNGHDVRYYKRDFWSEENPKYLQPHFRLQKAARTVNRLGRGRPCDLLDVGCGPGTLMRLLTPNIHYHGIDIAIADPAPNLIEADILEAPITFLDRRFDIVVAQGLFEYLGDAQSRKFAEIARLMNQGGWFIASYVNFGHRDPAIYWPYSNVQPIEDFRVSLSRDFVIRRQFPTSHNWKHGEPTKRLVMAANMHLNVNLPMVSPWLAVEYFFLCSPRI